MNPNSNNEYEYVSEDADKTDLWFMTKAIEMHEMMEQKKVKVQGHDNLYTRRSLTTSLTPFNGTKLNTGFFTRLKRKRPRHLNIPLVFLNYGDSPHLIEEEVDSDDSEGVGVGRRGLFPLGMIPNTLFCRDGSSRDPKDRDHLRMHEDKRRKIKVFSNGKTVVDVEETSIEMVFVSREAYGILTKDDFLFLRLVFNSDMTI
uniref:Uncharacterized protein n=1 Tax=Tanacetum cinerariifolium TaxID=118510 RepID=A0A6L2MUB6_TANCI|nr:hypothetical protein [Tanacetum cinerariifolium]